MTRLNLGGPARQALASDPLLRERGHAVRLYAGHPEPGEGDLFDRFVELGHDVVRVPGLRRGLKGSDFRAARFLTRELTELAPDVIHTHAFKAGTLGRNVARKRRFANVARVHTFHGHVLEGYFPAPMNRLVVRHERIMAGRTDRVLAVSHATADDLVRLGVTGEEKLVVVPPGIDLEPYLALPRPRPRETVSGGLRELCGVGPDDFLLGFVARLVEVKQPELAFDVIRPLALRYPNLHLVFVGDGPLFGMLERRIRSIDPERAERVHLVGSRVDMPPVFAELDAVLLTSRSEGLPVALIEAAASGLPALATDVGGVSEIVAHERTGWVGEKPDDLAFGLDQLLANPAEREAMGTRARVRVAKRHSAKHLADRLEEVYTAVVEERTCAS